MSASEGGEDYDSYDEEGGSLINSWVWVRDDAEAWVLGSIQERKDLPDGRAAFVISRQDNAELTAVTDDELFLCNIFEEGGTLSDVTDLTYLTHLHEPAVLESLCLRFDDGKIYTNTGPILLAVNPFKTINGLYTKQLLEMYYSTGLLKSQNVDAPKLPPHIYATADNAYRALVDSGDDTNATIKQNQSILVSGESGAGKTESTKFIMKYLATVANQKSYRIETTEEKENGSAVHEEIADMVLKSNPILESFGNARTNRNDNSSRFGKFIEMQFNFNGNLVGAKIKTYLLEKVRLSRQAEGERNYHIFYQLMKGATEEEKKAWRLDSLDLETCGMTKQSNCLDRKDGVDDESTHERMWKAMDIMGFSQEEKETIVKIVASVMHLSNFKFVETSEGGDIGSKLDLEDTIDDGNVCKTNLEAFKELLSLDSATEEDIQKSLCWRKRTVNKEVFNNCLSPEAASDARDALGKTIYSRMFDWIVKRVNESIEFDEKKLGRKERLYFIGVLDIFGFEVFEHNSFEQLCINYANETLQQQFNQFVFKLEQQEYERENIKWDFIDFPDNQKCLTLIDGKKPPGILKLLDEQCLFPNGSDEKFARKLYELLIPPKGKGEEEEDIVFSASPKEKVENKFAVHHYAGKVVYDTNGFTEKNKDQLFQEALDLMSNSTMPLMKYLFPTGEIPSKVKSATISFKSKTGNSIQAVTVGDQFKGQLAELLEKIKSTAPHYVRCLKPNDKNVPDEIVRQRLVDQLRYGGVLEAVKVARAGYPVRMLLPEFGRRYACLVSKRKEVKEHIGKRTLKEVSNENGGKWLCTQIIEHLGFEKYDDYQVGKTKLFIRKPVYETLEEKRSLYRKVSAIKLQAASRRMVHLRKYRLVLFSALRIQRKMRIIAAKARLELLRRTKAATTLQKTARRLVYQKQYETQRKGMLQLQALYRGIQGRKSALDIRKINAVTKISSIYLGYKHRKQFRKYVSALISLQCMVRVASAKTELKTLKTEARQVGNLQGKLKELQNKVVSLQKELREETERRIKLEEEKAHLEDEMQTISASNTTDEMRTLRTALQAQRAENGTLMEKIEELKKSLKQNDDNHNSSNNNAIPNGSANRDRDEEAVTEKLSAYEEENQRLREQLNAKKGEMSYWKNQMYDDDHLEESSKKKDHDNMAEEDIINIKLYNEELESKVEELKKVCVEQREELNKLYMSNNTTDASKADTLQEKVERLTILCNEKSEEVNRLNQKLLESASGAENADLSVSLSSEISILQARVSEMENERSILQDSLDEFKSSNVILSKLLEEEKETVYSLEKELEHSSKSNQHQIGNVLNSVSSTDESTSASESHSISSPQVVSDEAKLNRSSRSTEKDDVIISNNNTQDSHEDMTELKQILANYKVEKAELVEITMELQKEKEELIKTRNDFAQENIDLKKKSVDVEEKLAAYVTRMCDAENRANEHHNEFVALKKDNQNLAETSRKLEEKLDAMEILAEQASGVKIALAKRLEELILENRALNGSVKNSKDEISFYKDSIKMLTHELKETQQQLRNVQRTKGQAALQQNSTGIA